MSASGQQISDQPNRLPEEGLIDRNPVQDVSYRQEYSSPVSGVAWTSVSYLPIEPGWKEQQEQKLLALFAHLKADLLVLARYMQILTDNACCQLDGRAINIHHSFLPGCKGVRPYHQGYARGVKLIGATAHYVNDDFDERPIIEQAVERIDHSMSVDQ